MNTTTAAERSGKHICTFPDLEMVLRSQGVACVTFRYLDADSGGIVSNIEYFDADGEHCAMKIPVATKRRVKESVERDALQFYHGRFAGKREQAMRWQL